MTGGNFLISNAVVLGADDGSRDHARVQHRLRSGGRPVQHHELPRRVERSADRRARHLRRADRPRRHRDQHRPSWTAPRPVRGAGAEHARGRLQGLRHVRAGYVAGETEPDADGRHPLRHPDAVRPVHERHVVGDDGRASAAGRASATATSTAGATVLDARRLGRRHAAVHPARERDRRLQDGPEQLRAVGQHRLAAERAVRVPAHDPRRSGPGDAPRRILRSLRSSGPDPVHRPSTAATAAPRSR